MHRNIKRVRGNRCTQTPTGMFERCPTHHLATSLYQARHDLQLRRRQGNGIATIAHGSCQRRYFNVAMSWSQRLQLWRATHQGTYPCNQLLHGKRLSQIVVSARLETRYPVMNRITSSQNQTRYQLPLATKTF